MPPIVRSGIATGTSPLRRGGVDVEFRPSPYILANQFNTLGANVRSFKVPLDRSIRQVLSPSLKENFAVGGRPVAWEFLLEETVKRKSEKKYRSPSAPLIATGLLARVAGQINIWKVDGPQGLAYINALPQAEYGVIHQVGNLPNLPQRMWAQIQESDANDIEEIFFDWIEERVNLDMPGT